MRVLDQAAAELNAPLLRISTADLEWRQELGLRGPHQRLNAALAVEAVTTLWPNLSESSIERGLREVIWPGRFDLRAGNIVIDGAHNPAAMEALVSTWIEEFGIEARAAVVFGAANSKDVPEIFSKLAPITQTFIFVELSAERGLKMTELESAFGESDVRDIPCLRASDVSTALELAKTADLPILVTGSLFLAGETLSLCDDRSSRFEPSEQ